MDLQELSRNVAVRLVAKDDRDTAQEIIAAAMRSYADQETAHLHNLVGNYEAELAAVRELCLRHQHHGVVTGAHSLASAVLKIIGGAE